MKYLLLVFMIIFSLQLNAQVSFYGPTQVGNGNIQNNYMRPKFSEGNKKALNNVINKVILDSEFNHIKYYKLSVSLQSNTTEFCNGLREFLKSKGYKEILYSTFFNAETSNGIDYYLEKKDSALVFTVNQL